MRVVFFGVCEELICFATERMDDEIFNRRERKCVLAGINIRTSEA